YPRLSRITRRKGTGYLRFCARDAGVAFRAVGLLVPRRGAAARAFVVRAFAAGVGATRRAAVFGRAGGAAGFATAPLSRRSPAEAEGCGSRARAGLGSGVVRTRGSGAAGVVR